MKIAVLKESAAGEPRVAAIPETVKKFIALGAERRGRDGARANAPRSPMPDYEAAGATSAARAEALKDADIILCVQGPARERSRAPSRARCWSARSTRSAARARSTAYAAAGLEALAMEWMPRITRAQSMDILSSQSNLAGYKAVLDAAGEYGRAFPMMMTAAGTVSRGQGVRDGRRRRRAAGDRHRRGGWARRSAPPTSARRPRSRSCRSAPSRSSSRTSPASRARARAAMPPKCRDEYKAAQAELVSGHIAKQDIVITTALIPGRPAPRLISDAQVATMRPGSVIVDLAVEQGGNVEGAVAGEIVVSATASRSSATATCRAGWRRTPRRSSRATSTISSPLSGTRRQGAGAARTTTRSSRRCESRPRWRALPSHD